MAALRELYHVEHWQYRAEGNANLVLKYIGPNPRFKTTMLRLRKTDRQQKICEASKSTSSETLSTVLADKKENLLQESVFISKVFSLLLGQEYVDQLVVVSLPDEFLTALSKAIEPSRPLERLHKVIDLSQAAGFLALDHTRFIDLADSQVSVAVEIKPKWGFLTQSAFIRHENIKRRKCRHCMHQHLKMKSGHGTSLSEYCPIDLFSGVEPLVQDSLDALIRTPQNNLRLFINGTQQLPITKEMMVKCLFKTSIEEKPPQGNSSLIHKEESSKPISLVDVLTRILVQSPILKRLGRLQQALDSLDIETIHRFYTQLASPMVGTIPEPTLEEFLNTAESFLYRTDMNEMMTKDLADFLSNNASNLGFGPEDDLDDPNTVPDSLKLHYLREFLLSATLKDCSLLIAVCRADEIRKEADNASKESNFPSDRCPGIGTQDPLFKENRQRIKVKDEDFIYKITCIDLDPKKMTSIPLYLKKDREIVEHYLSVVGDREPHCATMYVIVRPARSYGPIQNAIAVLNLLSLLVGMILLCVGTFVYFAPGAVFVTSTLLPHLILVLGATISLVSFLGYYGTMNEKRWILWIHVLILLIAIALQITVGAFAFAYRNQGIEVLDKAWDQVYKSDPHVIQDLESFFQCCGFEHVLDRPVPVTCALDHHFFAGCRENIQTAFQDSLQAIGVIGAILGGIELVSLLGATVLFHRFDKQRSQRESEGEASLVRALLEAQHIDREIDEARRRRERQLEYEALAEQVRSQALARAQDEGLYGSRGRGGGSRDPPPYGTFDMSKSTKP
ncbi:Inositol-pentakisphosphate 2-kinase [Lobosporangium transversale]|uniref:Inositol-pentakisphosphate 2-kinase n=1 Tax=Lobosporangium transversale TaxID=64571 RepID=A0A1Y2GZ82_9FUNG|nr:inositol-pentakisphosphate 2-kinase-domain-containing protein [Lobosporangium transversale]KAF9903106.1 Inositol-pentakisphosphate 2-kinase [Lobosporangium transversale]ORZ27576.1 inositol-pentakisphosphate 2-kinase-domain-containing protein [Lobosporangium transversale]|eukprot:XP_021885279.1 inositol-pentakisphosphate 2-kinase-domain-containing protein [Lobosporangium transversale]